ncbi:MAG: hypothetical protein DLM60_02570 [Pseudonocardiales bacterium]|nr:hypothetical protein [Actinomycetota bacterium]PZS23495.1 MAG: hypothetical protein DLM60_02570 [Pseudonocardiales bacterium]
MLAALYSFRWMRCQGASGVVATWCLAASGLVSTGSLIALGLLGSLLADGWGSAGQLTMEITGVLPWSSRSGVRLMTHRPPPGESGGLG